MSGSYLSLSCDSFKNNIFAGFTRLQEQQEFVDLTLVADGHLVKVHKSIVALASPYIKEMIQSTSCHNPVIFLNNVRHNVLNYLLEYIYHGEVCVPQESLELFLQVSQSLHIAGFGKPSPPKSNQETKTSAPQPQVQKPVMTLDMTSVECERPKNIAACITINSDHNLEVQDFIENVQVVNADDIHINDEDQQHNNVRSDMEIDGSLAQDQLTLAKKDQTHATPSMQNWGILNTDSETPQIDLSKPLQLDKEAEDALKIITQYTVTERGAVQIIVSRYIYSSHHNSRQGRKHRWRCADYRKLHCPAFIDSLDNKIVLRKGFHNHAYHDERIYKKHKQGLIFHSYQKANEAKDLPNENKPIEIDYDIEILNCKTSSSNE